MITLDHNVEHNDLPEVSVRNVRFDGDMLFIELDDERQIGLPFKKIRWLDCLAREPPAKRANLTIEPYGYAVWWEELDDGFELEHALSLRPLPQKQGNKPIEPLLTAS